MYHQFCSFQCSSASRKFLKRLSKHLSRRLERFSALQRAENSSTQLSEYRCDPVCEFQCSSASRKFLNLARSPTQTAPFAVSVLFSEPKIPQHFSRLAREDSSSCFSALQRAENSSTSGAFDNQPTIVAFQCSSASRKFLNGERPIAALEVKRVSVLFSEPKIPQPDEAAQFFRDFRGFSALQRAENSSTALDAAVPRAAPRFQCSSASRKFLNPEGRAVLRPFRSVSVLFSEPKIPQPPPSLHAARRDGVSVLFSEPKIPQHTHRTPPPDSHARFSALQRAENSSTRCVAGRPYSPCRFQCSSASRKFLNVV